MPTRGAFAKLKRTAAALGWQPLRRCHTTHEDGANQKLVTWYESALCEGRRLDCFLQINELPIGQEEQFSGAVYAPRFRLCSGWHVFRLPGRTVAEVAEGLSSWLCQSHFSTSLARRKYRLVHPETVGYSWARINSAGPPYQILDATDGITQRVALR